MSKLVPCGPPKYVARYILNNPDTWEGFPVLERCVGAPIVGPNGKIETTAGYHKDSLSLYHPPDEMRVRPLASTLEQAEVDLLEAKNWISQLLDDFSYEDRCSKANAYAYLLNPFILSYLKGDSRSPMFAIDATVPGVGKTFLCDVASSVFTACALNSMHAPDSEREMRVTLTTFLSRKPSHLTIENWPERVEVKSGVLASMLTAGYHSDRILGGNKQVDLNVKHLTFAINGNALILSRELDRRAVYIRLVAPCEDLTTRKFKIDGLDSWAEMNRAPLVWSCLTVINAWLLKGATRFTGRKLPSYEEWSKVMGGILGEFGLQDAFLANGFQALNSNPELVEERDALIEFCEAVYGSRGSKPFTSAEAMELICPPREEGATEKPKSLGVYSLLVEGGGLVGWSFRKRTYALTQKLNGAWGRRPWGEYRIVSGGKRNPGNVAQFVVTKDQAAR